MPHLLCTVNREVWDSVESSAVMVLGSVWLVSRKGLPLGAGRGGRCIRREDGGGGGSGTQKTVGSHSNTFFWGGGSGTGVWGICHNGTRLANPPPRCATPTPGVRRGSGGEMGLAPLSMDAPHRHALPHSRCTRTTERENHCQYCQGRIRSVSPSPPSRSSPAPTGWHPHSQATKRTVAAEFNAMPILRCVSCRCAPQTPFMSPCHSDTSTM